jgi:transposase-like protein
LKARHNVNPRVITVDKNVAYPPAIEQLKGDNVMVEACEVRQIKYLNNIVEQDHRFIKRLVRPGLGFKSFHTL